MKRAEQLLLFLTLLFLPTQLGRHFWPSFSYVYSLPVDYFSPTIYFWDILVAALLVVFFINKKSLSGISLNIGLFFLFTQLISLLASSVVVPGLNIEIALVRLCQYTIAIFFGIYISKIIIKGNERIFFWGVLLPLLFESILGISQMVFGRTIGFWIFGERSFSIATPAIAKFDFYGLQFLRPYGTFSHPNILAAFLIIFLILLGVFLRKMPNVKKVESFFHSVAIFLSIAGIMASASRSAIFTFFNEFFFSKKSKKIFLFLLIICLIPFLYTRFSSLLTFDNLSLLRREYLIESGFNIFTKFPLSGIGLNNFILFLSGDYVPGPGRFLQPVHNIYLLILAETGVIGLIGWIVLIGSVFFKNLKLKITTYKLKIWLVILFLGLFDHYFLTLPQGYRILFFVWGLTLSENL